jgi:hypothetical protein
VITSPNSNKDIVKINFSFVPGRNVNVASCSFPETRANVLRKSSFVQYNILRIDIFFSIVIYFRQHLMFHEEYFKIQSQVTRNIFKFLIDKFAKKNNFVFCCFRSLDSKIHISLQELNIVSKTRNDDL